MMIGLIIIIIIIIIIIVSQISNRELDSWLQHLHTVVTGLSFTYHGMRSSAIWWGRPGGCSSPSRMQSYAYHIIVDAITAQGLHGLVCKLAPSKKNNSQRCL